MTLTEEMLDDFVFDFHLSSGLSDVVLYYDQIGDDFYTMFSNSKTKRNESCVEVFRYTTIKHNHMSKSLIKDILKTSIQNFIISRRDKKIDDVLGS